MKTIVRAATPADYPVLVALNKAAYPDYGETEEEWRHWDETWDHQKYFKSRVVAEDGGRVRFPWRVVGRLVMAVRSTVATRDRAAFAAPDPGVLVAAPDANA